MAEVAAVVAAAEGLARTGRPAEDAAPMVRELCPQRCLGRATGDDQHRGARRAGQGTRRRVRAARKRRGNCCSASPSMLWRPPTWAAAPVCGAAACSRTGRLELNAKTADRRSLGLAGTDHPGLL